VGFPFSTLTVGTDGSDSAQRAVGHAVRLAAATDADLVVVNAFGGVVPTEGHTGASREIGASLLRDMAARHAEHPRIRPVLRSGDAADVLLAVGAEEGADLIVVGNRGMGPKRQRIGNVPNRIAHRAPCDVLIAQTTGPAREGTYDRVLLATDGSPTAAQALTKGAELAERVGAETLVVSVGPQGRRVAEAAARQLPEAIAASAVGAEGEPAARIVEVAEERDCDLIVIGNRGMTGMRRFLASVPSRVVHAAPCHVLLVKTT